MTPPWAPARPAPPILPCPGSAAHTSASCSKDPPRVGRLPTSRRCAGGAAGTGAGVQNRSGSQTVTITRPDGTEVTVTSDRVKGLNARQAGALAQEIAGELGVPMQRRDPVERAGSAERAEREVRAEQGGAPAEPGVADGTAQAPGDGREEPGPDPEPGADGRRP
ncbi:hypothetical protein ACFWV1_11000 [Streptomyces sp. NPDC058700]|uniref:effector-associated constant component EACC1 n=1 Tax=Streptomyces sp. NPDC058700 TaxID=3346607 RepID=UPI00364E34BE